MKKFIVSLICVTAVFSGCAGSNESETKKLTLLAYDSFTPTEGIFDEFTQETGISVEVILGGDTGQLISKAILTSGNPEGDVLWGVDNTFLTRAVNGKVFSSYTSPQTKNMSDDVVALTQP